MSNPHPRTNWLREYLLTDVSKRLLDFIRPDRRYLVAAVLCAGGVSAMGLLVGFMGKHLVDAMIHQNQDQLNLYAAGIVAVYAVRWFFVYGDTLCFAEAGQRLGLRLRNDIYRHLQGLSLGFFNRQRTGALMSTMNNDVPVLQGAVSGLKDMATAPFSIIGGLIIIFGISWKLSLAAILVVPLMFLTINRLTRLMRQITRRTQDKLADVNTIMEETLSGIRIIQSFSAERQEIARFQQENQSAKDLAIWAVKQSARLKPSVDLIGAAGVAFALWVGGHLVVEREFTTGTLLFFIATVNQIAVGINGVGSAVVTFEQVQAAGRRILDNVLDMHADIQNAPGAFALPAVEGRIEFRRVEFAYNPHTPVLRGVTFTMNPGEVVAVVGPSGAGKSTIADLIPRFYDPQAGQVLVDGHDLRAVTLESLRRHIGIVPQETVLFSGTIRDNIAYGNPDATQDMIEEAARAANAHEFICDPRRLPDGYDTVVGERGKQLSGGQRQRIAIARALLKDPRILILDEATSSLDPGSEALVQEALETLMQGRTTLVIAHRLSTVQNAHKILVLQEGRIVESGTHADLIRMGGLYAQLYRRQLTDDDPPTRPALPVVAAS